jgi:hypothetical protein
MAKAVTVEEFPKLVEKEIKKLIAKMLYKPDEDWMTDEDLEKSGAVFCPDCTDDLRGEGYVYTVCTPSGSMCRQCGCIYSDRNTREEVYEHWLKGEKDAAYKSEQERKRARWEK